MEFTASPSDVLRVVDAARQIDGNPTVLVGRLLGLSGTDVKAGIPVWAWTAMALGVGVYLGMRYGDRIRDGVRAIE